jgi:hypothetical protein
MGAGAASSGWPTGIMTMARLFWLNSSLLKRGLYARKQVFSPCRELSGIPQQYFEGARRDKLLGERRFMPGIWSMINVCCIEKI